MYLRALLFVATGIGALVGALLVLSSLLLDDAEQRLLEERVSLARTLGRVLEERIRSEVLELERFAERVLLEPEHAREELLAHASTQTLFGNVIVLDTQREIVATLGPRPAAALDPRDLRLLVDTARARRRWVVDRPRDIGETQLTLVGVPVYDATGRALGTAVAVLGPDARRTLAGFGLAAGDGATSLSLVAAGGVVIASTAERDPTTGSDHDGVLARAISRRTVLRGRCHSCHEESGHKQRRDEVMAFAPLPVLPLGLAVMQPESQALAPAFTLRARLWFVGGALILLFVIFSLLSVHSVVRPIEKLTGAVRQLERHGTVLVPPDYGQDEIGELAAALAHLHERTNASLAAAESDRRALETESDAIRRHLTALHDISDYSTSQPTMEALLGRALARALELCRSERGLLYVEHRGRAVTARHGLTPDEAEAVRGHERRTSEPAGEAPPSAAELASRAPGEDTATSALVFREAALDLRVGLIVLRTATDTRAPPFAQSLLWHISMCTSHLLLKDAIEERRNQQAMYLRQVLQSQEDERQRIARELHDTVAQDLAALRLELERLLGRVDEPTTRERIASIEERTRHMLDTVRAILLDLRLSILDTMGIVPALSSLVQRAEREHGLRARFVLDGPDDLQLDYATSMTLFRILQEALLNVVRHARAEHVFVTLVATPQLVELIVEDDGVGFVAGQAATGREGVRRGFGLLGMEERARLVGGALEVASSPSDGTQLRVRLPRASAPDPALPVVRRSAS